MKALLKFLPGTGRGTKCHLVEGSLATGEIWSAESDPSVTPSARHLPVPGRI